MRRGVKVWAIAGPLEGLAPATIKYLLSREQVVIALAPDESASGRLRQWGCAHLNIVVVSPEKSAHPLGKSVQLEESVPPVEDNVHSLEEITRCHGPIDTLVVNIAYGLIDLLDPGSDSEMKATTDSSLRYTMDVVKRVLPYMNQHPSGQIISMPPKPCVLMASGEPIYDERATAVKYYCEALEKKLKAVTKALTAKITYFASDRMMSGPWTSGE